MLLESSLGEAYSVLRSIFESSVDDLYASASSVVLNPLLSPQVAKGGSKVDDQKSLITPAPRLILRNPTPQNGGDCAAQAAQSASQAIQQVNQAASESIRQISQSASQAVQQASQSAANQLQDVSNSASQSIAAASRSVSAFSSSASSAISRALSAQAEASQAISRARVILATGTVPAEAAESANRSAPEAQTVAISATQAALAIIGSIIASTLITVTIVYLYSRYKRKKAAAKSSSSQSSSSPAQSPRYPYEPKFSFTDQNGRTVAGSRPSQSRGKDSQRKDSELSLSMSPRTPTFEKFPHEFLGIRSTSVPWNPAQPPKVPKLGDWLKEQDAVSPFGSIKLPMDDSPNAPLGGQLRSPLQSTVPSSKLTYSHDLPLRSGAAPVSLKVERVTIRPVRNGSTIGKPAVKKVVGLPPNLPAVKKYEVARAVVWKESNPVASSRGPSPEEPRPHLREPTKPKVSPEGGTRKTTSEWRPARKEAVGTAV